MPDEDASDAFALLGSAARIGVLRALAAAEHEHGDDPGPYDVSFAALYDAVDVDSSSAFAYHLDRLEGVFVERTDHGYRLSDRGQRVVRAILAGTYTEPAAFGPVTLDGYCPLCGATLLRATHDADRLTISCGECEARLVSEELTASQVADRTDDEVLASVATRIRADLDQAIDGVCGSCGGRVDIKVEDVGPGHATDTGTDEARPMFRGDCRACHRRVNAPIECCLFYHPAVRGFYWEHGVDLRAEPLWMSLRRLDGDEWHVDPSAADYVCTVTLGDGLLQLTVSPSLDVESVSDSTPVE